MQCEAYQDNAVAIAKIDYFVSPSTIIMCGPSFIREVHLQSFDLWQVPKEDL
jgi:hypothetical protein